ncbi:hypothetical protein [Blastococcus montanus]|uniref:hypothetical protein n=1 Tax=Blastococcus montanus TaxID=3144973 RepID=UPI0032090F0E
MALVIGIGFAVVATTWLQTVSTSSYTAEAALIVPLEPPLPDDAVVTVPDPRPSSPYDAERTARNYAVLLTQDRQFLEALSAQTGIPVDELVENSDAVNLPSSAVVRVTYTSSDELEVRSYFDALADVLVAPVSPSPNLPAGTLLPLRLPETIEEQPGLSPAAPYIGAAAGLLLGLATAVLLERLLTQVRSAADIRALVPWPVLTLPRNVSPERYETIVLRVLESALSVGVVGIVTAGGGSADASARFAGHLREAEARLRQSGRLNPQDAPVSWQPLGRIPDDGSSERALQDADAVVLALPRRPLLRPVTLAIQRLETLAVGPALVVLGVAEGRRLRSLSSQAGQEEPPPVVADAEERETQAQLR